MYVRGTQLSLVANDIGCDETNVELRITMSSKN